MITENMFKSMLCIEKALGEAILGCSGRHWDEDHITHTWLTKLVGMGPSLMLSSGSCPSMKWDVFKLRGKLENQHGDVAFVVRLTFKNGSVKTGVGLLEAKRLYSTERYDAIDDEQLRREVKNSAAHQVLLYNDKAPNLESALVWWHLFRPSFFESCPFPAMVVPTRLVLASGLRDGALNWHGVPLSEQIVMRYFRGLDLDFEEQVCTSVLSGAIGGIKFIVAAHVVFGESTAREFEFRIPVPEADAGFGRIEDMRMEDDESSNI